MVNVIRTLSFTTAQVVLLNLFLKLQIAKSLNKIGSGKKLVLTVSTRMVNDFCKVSLVILKNR